MDENDIFTPDLDEPRADALAEAGPPSADHQSLILSLPVPVQVVLGSATLPVSNLMKLGRGAVITLDKRVGDTVDVLVSGRLVARGEVVVISEADSRYGVSLTEIVAASDNRPK